MNLGEARAPSEDIEEQGAIAGDAAQVRDALDDDADGARHEEQENQENQLAEEPDLKQKRTGTGALGEEEKWVQGAHRDGEDSEAARDIRVKIAWGSREGPPWPFRMDRVR